MAAPKRNETQIERDRRIVADLYCQGWIQADIAEYINSQRPYNITRQMISYDLKVLREQWRDSALVDIDQVKAHELAKIDRLEREYWDAWLRSCEDAEAARVEYDGSGSVEKLIERTEGQVGDSRFLRGVQWCIDKRCQIFGIDAPSKVEHAGRDGGPIALAHEGVIEIIEH